jgi:hypothetical protein
MNTSTANLIVLRELRGNAPTHLDPLQQLAHPYIPLLTLFWIAIWCGTLAFVIAKTSREYLAYRKNKRGV